MPGERPARLTRRLALAALAAGVSGLGWPIAAPAQPTGPGPQVLMVSRGRVLEEARAARRLSEAEIVATESLQRQIDAVKAELAAEEEELTRLRATLPREEFEPRVAAFDLRVREERRRAQSFAATLQRAYRDARRQLVDALGPILEEVRAERGAIAIIDAESVLAADPAMDVTARVIELYDERVSAPVGIMPSEPGIRGGAGGDGADPGNAPTPDALLPEPFDLPGTGLAPPPDAPSGAASGVGD